jgi:hypothetical protein
VEVNADKARYLHLKIKNLVVCSAKGRNTWGQEKDGHKNAERAGQQLNY